MSEAVPCRMAIRTKIRVTVSAITWTTGPVWTKFRKFTFRGRNTCTRHLLRSSGKKKTADSFALMSSFE